MAHAPTDAVIHFGKQATRSSKPGHSARLTPVPGNPRACVQRRSLPNQFQGRVKKGEPPSLLASLISTALAGVDAYQVEVEIDISSGLPALKTVGLPEGAARESLERVKSAVKNCGFDFPSRRITVNLAPADTRKEGSAFDLPIAL